MLRKILMAASLVATLFANSAIAGTWTATATATSYAAELFGDGTVLIDPGTANYQFSSTPTSGTAFNAEFTLAGASWGAALSSASLTLGAANVDRAPLVESGTASITLVEAGGVTDTTAKFRLDVTQTFTGNRRLILDYDIDGASGLSTPAASVTMGVSIVDTLGAIDTAGTAAAIATSAEGTSFATLPSTNVPDTGLKLIDVSSGSTTFVDTTVAGTKVNDLGSFTITNAGISVFEDNALNSTQGLTEVASTPWTIGTGDSTSATGVSTITLTGDFSAALAVDADSSALTFDGVQISGCTAATTNATTLDATTATFSVTDAVLAAMAGTACDVTLNIDGTTILQPQTPSVSYAFDYGNVDYRDETGTGSLATLSKNGASAAADLILTPGGVFDGFVRVSNKSGVAGKVIVTMYNDAGDAVTFDLDGGTLGSQASTALVAASDLYAQAQAADATFAHNDGKLRAVFEGEFSAIGAQSITISTDNTTFTTF